MTAFCEAHNARHTLLHCRTQSLSSRSRAPCLILSAVKGTNCKASCPSPILFILPQRSPSHGQKPAAQAEQNKPR